jgi:hypothetical protein
LVIARSLPALGVLCIELSRKRSSSSGNEKMERVGEGLGKIERYFSTGQSPQRAVEPTEEEEKYSKCNMSVFRQNIKELMYLN